MYNSRLHISLSLLYTRSITWVIAKSATSNKLNSCRFSLLFQGDWKPRKLHYTLVYVINMIGMAMY